MFTVVIRRGNVSKLTIHEGIGDGGPIEGNDITVCVSSVSCLYNGYRKKLSWVRTLKTMMGMRLIPRTSLIYT